MKASTVRQRVQRQRTSLRLFHRLLPISTPGAFIRVGTRSTLTNSFTTKQQDENVKGEPTPRPLSLRLAHSLTHASQASPTTCTTLLQTTNLPDMSTPLKLYYTVPCELVFSWSPETHDTTDQAVYKNVQLYLIESQFTPQRCEYVVFTPVVRSLRDRKSVV